MAESIIHQDYGYLYSDTTNNKYYYKFPEGTLIQWGMATIPQNNTETIITFPYAFNGNYYYGMSVLGVYRFDRNLKFTSSAESTTQAKVHTNKTATYANNFRWIAVGRWK